MINFIRKNIYKLIPIFFFLAILFSFIFVYNFFGYSQYDNQQFSELANSFLHYKLYFLNASPYNRYISDNVLFNNHYFWPLGPFPAIVLMPFVWLWHFLKLYFYQGYLNFFLVLSIFYIVFKIARQIKFQVIDSIYWSVAFISSSMFLGVAMISSSWYFAQTITVFLLFLSLLEYFGRKRYFLIGLIFGLILLSRVTAFIGILFFLLDLLLDKNIDWKIRMQNIAKLSIIPVICLILLFSYNYARFNNSLDPGYRAQILTTGFMNDKDNYGLFNLKYLPRGIYYSLVNMPQPIFNSETHLLNFPYIKADPWGMSIFLTSPYLLYLFFIKIKNRKTIFLLITSTIIWMIISSSFFIGYIQFGFRYALDFMPLLFTAFMIAYKDSKEKLSINLKIIIIISAFLNLYLLFNL